MADWELRFLPAIDAHIKSGRLDSAIVVCQAGLAEDSTRIVLYNLMASAQAAQGRFEPAMAALQTAVRLAPEFTAGWVNLAGILTKLGRFAEAVPYLERAARLDPGSAAAHRRLGEIYLRTGQHAKAAAEIAAAMDSLPDDATLTFFLGESRNGQGQAQAALEAYLRAGQLDPGYTEAQARGAELARQLGRGSVADSLTARFDRLQQVGDGSEEALATRRQLRQAVVNAPENAINHARLGGFYLYHDYVPEALALFDRAAALDPDNTWLLNEFGGLLSRKGRGDDALAYYQRALQVDPDFSPALVNTGGVLNALGRHDEALPYFERAVALAPADPAVRFFLAVTYISLDRHDDARQHLQQALAELGDHDEALKQQIEAALASLAG